MGCGTLIGVLVTECGSLVSIRRVWHWSQVGCVECGSVRRQVCGVWERYYGVLGGRCVGALLWSVRRQVCGVWER